MPMTAPMSKPSPATAEPAQAAPQSSLRQPSLLKAKPAQPKGRTVDLSKQALAHRLVASLAPHLPPLPGGAAQAKERNVSEPALATLETRKAARPAIARELGEKPVAGPVQQAPAQKAPARKPAAAPKPAPDLVDSYALLTSALVQAQDIARETALQIADTRLQAANSLIGLQQKLLELVHANLNASFAMAQKIVATPNLGDAMAMHRRYAQEQVLSLTEQAAEIRKLSTQLAEQAPWADFWRRPPRG